MAFERVCGLSEVPEDGALRVELADVDVAVVRYEGEVYAIQDVCSHAEVPLSEGDVEEFHGAPTIECWLHGSCFDLRTGEPTNLPATEPVSVYPVRVEGEDVYVDTETPGTSTGYCMARNSPARARSSTLIARTSSPSRVTVPPVIVYFGCPAIE